MSKFYGTVKGSAKTEVTRRGHDSIKVAAQSWDGSVIVEMAYDQNNNLRVAVYSSDESSTYGDLEFYGTFADFINQLRK